MNNTEKYAGSVTIYDDQGNIVFERNMSGDEMVEELLKKITDQAVAGALTGAATTIHAGNIHEVFSTVEKKLTTKYPATPGSGKIKIPKNKPKGKKKTETTKTTTGGSDRLQEINKLIAQGMKPAEVAKELGIPVSAVYQRNKKATATPTMTALKSEEEFEATNTGSDKNKQILDMLHDGIDEAEIAEKLGVRKAVVNMVKYSAKKRGEIFH